jgi:hypothetical protein
MHYVSSVLRIIACDCSCVESGSSKTRWVRAVVRHLRAAGLSQNSFSTVAGCNLKHVPKRIGLMIALREPRRTHQRAVRCINCFYIYRYVASSTMPETSGVNGR